MRTYRAWVAGLFLAFVLAITGACSSRGDGGQSASTATPGASATATNHAAPSATSQPLSPGLQKILNDVASVRQLAPPPTLQVNLIARSDLPALMESLLTPEDRKWFRDTTTLYRLLGHFRDDQDYESVYQSFGSQAVLGLYSPLDDALWVVHEDGQQVDLENLPADQKSTLAHELVHAIQDYQFKLDQVYTKTVGNLDWGLTYTSAVEGDAVVHEREYTKKFSFRIGSGPVMFAAAGGQVAYDVPPSVARELLFPYTTGVDWIGEIKRSLGLAKVNEIIQDPPMGSTYVMHPELLAQGFKPADVRLPDVTPALGSGWQRQSGGQFGEFQVRNYLQLHVSGGRSATAAQGWQGDHYDVYVNGDQSVATFRLRFASEQDAKEFVDAQKDWLTSADGTASDENGATLYQTSNGKVTATAPQSGEEVIFAIGSSKDVAAKAIQALMKG